MMIKSIVSVFLVAAVAAASTKSAKADPYDDGKAEGIQEAMQLWINNG